MTDCQYHPARRARWVCTVCNKSLCDQCLVTDGEDPMCSSCGGQMEYLPNQDDVVPFWNRISDFFRYPFQKDAIALVVITALVGALSSVLILGIILSLFWFMVQVKYGYSVIAEVSKGTFKTPALIDSVAGGGGWSLVVKTIGIFILMGLMVFAALQVHVILGVLAVFFFTLAMPMSFILLAVNEDLIAAVNPMNLFNAIWRIGWPYFLVYLYLFMMTSCSATLAGFLVYSATDISVATAATSITSTYFMIVMYCLMGYLVHQFRFKLDFGPSAEDLKIKSRNKTSDVKVKSALLDGRYEEALKLMESQFNQNSEINPVLLTQYQKTLAFTQQWSRLETRAELIVKNLMMLDRSSDVSRVLTDIWKHGPKWEFTSDEVALNTARYLNSIGDYSLAFRAIKNIYKRQTQQELRDGMVDLLAKLLRDNLGQPEVAEKILLLKQKELIQASNYSNSNSKQKPKSKLPPPFRGGGYVDYTIE